MKRIISNGWKKAEICGLMDGTTELPPEDPQNKPIISCNINTLHATRHLSVAGCSVVAALSNGSMK